MKERKLYHIYPRGVRRGDLFESPELHALFQFLFIKYARELGVEVILLVPMTNHYHAIILCEPEVKPLFMQKVNWAFAMSFNQGKDLSGHAFERSCKGTEIFDNFGLVTTARYDFLNPVVAGMAPSPMAYPYSSYAGTVGLAPLMDGVNPDRLLQCFSPNRTEAQRLLREYVEVLTPDHPVVREAGKRWDRKQPNSSKARNCRWVVEFAAMTALAISKENPGLEFGGNLTLSSTDLQLWGMYRFAGASQRIMSAVLDLSQTSVNRMLRRLKSILNWDPQYEEALDQKVRLILSPHREIA
jgi:REP element-mobilizing transposase RayT